MKLSPVHLNQDPAKLFVCKVGNDACLVLTELGPVQAKAIAESHFRAPCSGVRVHPAPLLCPDARLVDKIVDGAVEVMTRTVSTMTLFRFEVKLTKTGQLSNALVWTNTRLKGATAFCNEAVKGYGELTGKVMVVRNPLIVDRSNVTSILEAG